MFIFVNIKNSYVQGSDPKQFAIGNWVSKRLLIDPDYRNKYRFLVAYANKKILGVYKIIGIKRVLNLQNRQRVCFDVDSLNPAFEVDLINKLQSHVDQNDQRIIFNMHIRFLDDFDLSIIQEEYHEEFANLNFPIEENNDPVFEIGDQYFDAETIAGLDINDHPNMAHPIEPIWYQITVNYHSFDSFRTPLAINTKTTISLSPSGIIKIDKVVNDIRVNARLDRNSKNRVIHLIQLFNNAPNSLLQQLNESDKLNHVAHSNPISLHIKAFSDAARQHVVREFFWEDNVAFAKSGLLNVIFQLFI